MMKRKTVSLTAICVLAGIAWLVCVSTSRAQAPAGQAKPDLASLRKAEEELSKLRRELLQNEADLLKTQSEAMSKTIDALKADPKTAKAAIALAAILDLKAAELKLKQARANAQAALEGAKLVAADGVYLGRIGPSYDTESIFCTFGDYGATYSQKSIWCTYGKYGGSSQELSPFCRSSLKWPKLLIGDTVVASVSVSPLGVIVLSPESLRAMNSDRTDTGLPSLTK